MEIGSLTSSRLTEAATGSSQDVSSQDFMKLLTTQLSNQNPLSPMSDTEFMGQLAQLTSVEEAEKQSSLLEQILAGIQSTNVLEGIGNAASLVDREVTYADGANVVQGRVDAVRFLDGVIQLEIGEKLVPLGNVLQVVGEGDSNENAGSGSDADADAAAEADEDSGASATTGDGTTSNGGTTSGGGTTGTGTSAVDTTGGSVVETTPEVFFDEPTINI